MFDIFYYKSPIGILEIKLQKNTIISIKIVDKINKITSQNNYFSEVKKQLDKYFSGENITFKLNVSPIGTEFQKKVWKALKKIPYGETKSYSEIAEMIDNPTAQRAVGSACGKNPILILIPCHRVISKNGLGGFSCGIKVKKQLLNIEKT